jgi:ssRNA-specific RNase YbeY (16S rRNA maturation enzyme)
LGHDHETAREAKKMDLAERELLGESGMVGAAWPRLNSK